MPDSNQFVPCARKADLLTKEIPEELLIYDVERHQSLCLNASAALIWNHCDGRKSVSDLSRLLEAKLGLESCEDIVWHGLSQLERFHLLEGRIDPPRKVTSISRRLLVRKLGTAAVMAIPVVFALNVPTAAQAASPGPTGATGPTGPTGLP